MPSFPTTALEDLAINYQLALSTGVTLDLKKACSEFIKVLMTTRRLSHASVWRRHIGADGQHDELSLVHAYPRRCEVLKPTAQLDKIGANEWLVLSAEEAVAQGLIGPEQASDGRVVFYGLADVAILRLAATGNALQSHEQRRLATVFSKFALTLQACLAHQNLEQKVAEVTEAQQSLAKSRALLLTLANSLPAGILIEDASRHVLQTNAAFMQMFGIPAPPEALIGSDCVEAGRQTSGLFVDAERFMTRVDEILAHGVEASDELYMVDGRILERTYIPLVLDTKATGHLWQYRDVTERRRNKKQLERLSLVASQTHNGVVITDAHGRVEWVNAAFENNTGFKLDEIVERKPKDFLQGPGTSEQTVAEMSAALGKRDPFSCRILNYRKNRTEFWASLMISPIFDDAGEFRRFVAIQLEDTERVRSEQLIEHNNQRLRQLLEHAPDTFITTDADGLITTWNPMAAKTFGWSSSEALGLDAATLLFPTGTRTEFNHTVAQAKSSGQPTARIELNAVTKLGHEFAIELTAYRVIQREELSVGMFMRDITERRAVDRMKDELVTNVSHELRTPLTSLQGFVELLLTREYPKEKRDHFLKILHEETMRLTRMVNDFLDVQRIQAGKYALQCRPVNVGELLEEVAATYREEQTAQTIVIDIADDLPSADVDASRIRQVLSHLLSNAVKFSVQPGTVTLGATHKRDALAITVHDEGIGIPKNAQKRIFEKFYRVEDATARAIGGSGLGLALVRELVEAHGGMISVDSTPGSGSIFKFTLPVANISTQQAKS